jgi:hypothetical protein
LDQTRYLWVRYRDKEVVGVFVAFFVQIKVPCFSVSHVGFDTSRISYVEIFIKGTLKSTRIIAFYF